MSCWKVAMSFWSRRSDAIIERDHRVAAIGAFMIIAGGAAVAADVYVQPRADIGVEVDTNRDMVSSGPTTTAEGTDVEAGATVGIATPESDTTLRPQVRYYDYPELDETSLEGRMDFASTYNSQRNQFGIYGEFDRRDLYGSELASATFNPVNPNLPTTPETGRISEHGARTLFTVVPRYSYNLTERLSFQASGIYQNIGYSGANSADYIPYDYYDIAAGLDWKLSPRSDISLGIDGSKDSAKDTYSVTDGHGVTLTYNYQWSKVFTSSFALVGEQYDVYGAPSTVSSTPITSKVAASGIGATYQTTWQGQVSQIQATVGRTFTPSGAGGSYTSDQLQIEYKRQLKARLLFDGAAHYIRNVALSSQYEDGNYDYLVVTADLRWMLTRTWYVAGGLQYLEEKSPVAGTSANNSMAHVSFGYEGLNRQY
jgi:hypothetical protein